MCIPATAVQQLLLHHADADALVSWLWHSSKGVVLADLLCSPGTAWSRVFYLLFPDAAAEKGRVPQQHPALLRSGVVLGSVDAWQFEGERRSRDRVATWQRPDRFQLTQLLLCTTLLCLGQQGCWYICCHQMAAIAHGRSVLSREVYAGSVREVAGVF